MSDCYTILEDDSNDPIILPALLKLSSPLTRYGAKPCTVLLHYLAVVHFANPFVRCQYHFHITSIFSPPLLASNVGFNTSAVYEWLSTSHVAKDVTSSNASDPLLGYPLVAISPTKWARADHQDRLSMIHCLRFMAMKAASYNLCMVSSDFLKDRPQTLIKFDISKWAGMIKPATNVSQGFAASWSPPLMVVRVGV